MKFTQTFSTFIAIALLLTACAPLYPAPMPLPEILPCGNAKSLMTNLTIKKSTRQYMTEDGRLCLPEAAE